MTQHLYCLCFPLSPAAPHRLSFPLFLLPLPRPLPPSPPLSLLSFFSPLQKTAIQTDREQDPIHTPNVETEGIQHAAEVALDLLEQLAHLSISTPGAISRAVS